MNRRGFFGKLGHGVLAVPAAVIAFPGPVEAEKPQEAVLTREYHDCTITGSMLDNCKFVACNIEGNYIVGPGRFEGL